MAKKIEAEEKPEESKEEHEEVRSSRIRDPTIMGLLALVVVLLLSLVYFAYQPIGEEPTGGTTEGITTPLEGTTGGDNVGSETQGTGEKLQILEFSDFECSYCARAAPTVEKIKEEFGDKVEVIYKHFPLSSHANAQKAAEASECARDQDKFWEMHDILFENQRALGVDYLKQYAADLGLDTDTFNSCLDNGDKEALVKADFQEGVQKGVSGTPAFFIGEFKVVGAQPYEVFKQTIERALAGEEPAPEPTPEPEPVVDVDMEELVDDDPYIGSLSAPITIVEFSEFLCPFCKRFATQTLPQIDEEYIQEGKVRLVFRDFIVHGERAQLVHEAVECADDQGKFWEYHDEIFEGADTSSDGLKQIAVDLGLDTEEFNECVDSRKHKSEIEEDTSAGRAAGVRGTPTSFINGRMVRGARPYEVFKQIIDEELEKAG